MQFEHRSRVDADEGRRECAASTQDFTAGDNDNDDDEDDLGEDPWGSSEEKGQDSDRAGQPQT